MNGPRSRRTTRLAGGAALSLLLAALAGVVAGYWLSGLDVSFFGDDAVRQYDAGPGYTAAATGLVVALFGLLVLLAGRWEARTRGALKREAKARQRARAAAREAELSPSPRSPPRCSAGGPAPDRAGRPCRERTAGCDRGHGTLSVTAARLMSPAPPFRPCCT